jgi:hypothetical protein
MARYRCLHSHWIVDWKEIHAQLEVQLVESYLVVASACFIQSFDWQIARQLTIIIQ